MTESKHFTLLTDGRKNEYTAFVKEGNDVNKITDVRVLHIDNVGVTIEEMKRMGKNRIIFVPHINLIMLRSEIV
ncbi:MAG: hypothetical protein OEZ01_10080 [Candidatus Heimdallarchaeota archaeon]|nr:hypothetical protein [Candidatus Heimdallarchaeota archaeon]MDH5646346.1 hypothetical protein [Candidatus Heimdallarchaeota archaeon]